MKLLTIYTVDKEYRKAKNTLIYEEYHQARNMGFGGNEILFDALLYIQNKKNDLCLKRSVEIHGGALEMDSAKLLKDFFQRKRLKS